MRSGSHLRCGAAVDRREFRAGLARRARSSGNEAVAPGDRRADCRCARPGADVSAHGGLQARHRLPRRCAQTRTAARAGLGRRHQDQRLRLGQRRRCGSRRWRSGDGDDFDRQSDRAGFYAWGHQAVRRNVLPGARRRFGPPRAGGAVPDAPDRGALWQRACLQWFGCAEIQGANRCRRPGHRHASRRGAVFHDHSRGLRSRHDRGEPRARSGALGCFRLCPQHGPAGENRRSRRGR